MAEEKIILALIFLWGSQSSSKPISNAHQQKEPGQTS